MATEHDDEVLAVVVASLTDSSKAKTTTRATAKANGRGNGRADFDVGGMPLKVREGRVCNGDGDATTYPDRTRGGGGRKEERRKEEVADKVGPLGSERRREEGGVGQRQKKKGRGKRKTA